MPKTVQEIFAQACELDPAGRASFVRDACQGDDALRAEVESLLAAHDGAGRFMASPTAEFVEPAETISATV